MGTSRLPVIVIIALALVGAVASSLLLGEHFQRSKSDGWFNSVCKLTGDGCREALQSRWAYFPPKPSDEPAASDGDSATQPDTQPAAQTQAAASQPETAKKAARAQIRIPVAMLGAVYFTSMAVWFIGIGRANRAGRGWHLLPLCLSALGVLASIGFIVVMFTQLEAACAWCLVCHIANLIMFPFIVLLYPRRAFGVGVPAADATVAAMPAGASSEGASYPSNRLAGVTLLASAAVAAALISTANSMALTSRNREYERVVAEYLQDGAAMYASYMKGPKHDLADRPGSHSRGGGGLPLQTVIFADFQCVHCREMTEFLERRVQPIFRSSLRIVFRHYPLCTECNPQVKNNVHPSACKSARAAEAAFVQGGNEAFWRAHDRLFADQAKLARYDYAEFAKSIGLDPDRLLKDMDSQTVKARIDGDIELAKSLNIEGTPRVFVSGKEVPTAAMKQLPFWKTLAEAYDTAVRKQQHEKARATSPHG